MRRALGQMTDMTKSWAGDAFRRGDAASGETGLRISSVARAGGGPDDDERLDPYLIGEAWWHLVRPLFADIATPRRRYLRLRDLDELLREQPLPLPAVQAALRRIPKAEPVDKRISAAIIGVPDSPAPGRRIPA